MRDMLDSCSALRTRQLPVVLRNPGGHRTKHNGLKDIMKFYTLWILMTLFSQIWDDLSYHYYTIIIPLLYHYWPLLYHYYTIIIPLLYSMNLWYLPSKLLFSRGSRKHTPVSWRLVDGHFLHDISFGFFDFGFVYLGTPWLKPPNPTGKCDGP